MKPIYFFDRGQAVVADKNIDFTITSHFGSTLNIKYTGSINFKKKRYSPTKDIYCQIDRNIDILNILLIV